MDTNLLAQIDAQLSTEVKEFAKSMFLDSRLLQDPYVNIWKEPEGVDAAIDLFTTYGRMLGRAVRKERPDLIEMALEIENTDDTLERIAIWALRYKSSDQ